jgi:hypothetical protein
MNRGTKPTRSSTSDPSRSYLGPNFGTLLHSRRYTGTSYFLAAAFMFFPLPMLALYAITTGPPQSLGFKLSTFAISIGMAAGGAAFFVVKGRRKTGLIVEFYERGMRFARPPANEEMFLFADVKELKRRTISPVISQARGGRVECCASVSFPQAIVSRRF